MIDGAHVATLVATGGDFPWVYGTVEPGPDFDRCPLNEEVEGYEPDRDERWLDHDALAEAGHPPHSLLLVAAGDADDNGKTYLHAVVLRSENVASWRLGPHPIELDE